MAPFTFKARNLGGRQKELNEAVKNTKSWNNEVSSSKNEDSDMLYKIDVASKFKNVQYLIQTLKSGDSLYISRVLKHVWIFDIQYADIINPEYLRKEIFPFMSQKMINKLLTTISIHVKDEERVISFCNYCFKVNKKHLGYKFLINTPVLYKIETLKKVGLEFDKSYLKNVIGDSLVVADFIFDTFKWSSPLHVPYLYSISAYEYLNLFEKYECYNRRSFERTFGARFTKDVIKKHKDRVLSDPRLYLHFLNFKVVCRNIDVINAKELLKNVLPSEVEMFWDEYRKSNIIKDLLNKIPLEYRFQFIKEIFNKKYVGEEFENSKNFYLLEIYKSMTKQQQIDWATRNIALNNGFFGDKNDYSWYKFLPFEDSFKVIKTAIHKCTDRYARMNMLFMMLEIASNEKEIEQFLKYFYDRHTNETFRDRFIYKVVDNYEVFNFNKNLWELVNKLLILVDGNNKCKTAAVLYSLSHDISLIDSLKCFVNNLEFDIQYLKQNIKKCQNMDKVVDQIINEIINKLTPYENVSELDTEIINIIYKSINILKAIDKDVTTYNIIIKLASLNKYRFKELFPNTEGKVENPVRLLKKDIAAANKQISIINTEFNRTVHQVRLNQVLRKLRIYFGNDGSKEWIDYYKEVLNNKKSKYGTIYGAVYGIFALDDSDQRSFLVNTYVPQGDRIKETASDNNTEHIQIAICKFSGHCRPPVPLDIVMQYIRGDYVKYCLPLFEILSANLPAPLCVDFIEKLLQKPVSVQKHGLRLAFKKFDSPTLIKIVTCAWQNTRNVSLKQVIFVSLYKHIGNEKDIETKKLLIDVLKNCMVTLSKDDCNEQVMSCFMGDNIPDDLKGDFYECAYKVVVKLGDVKAVRWVVTYITNSILFISEELLTNILKDLILANLSDLVNFSKDDENIYMNLLVTYIVKVPSEDLIENRIQVLEKFTSKLIESWDYIDDNVYVIQKIAFYFFESIASVSLNEFVSDDHAVLAVSPVKVLLQTLIATLSISAVYSSLWRLNISIIMQEVIHMYRKRDEYNIPVSEYIEMPTSMILIIDIGRQIGILVKEFVDKNQFFMTFLNQIGKIISESINYLYCKNNVVIDDCMLALCIGILETDIIENYMLALTLIPSTYFGSYESYYEATMKKIVKGENDQLQSMVQQKLYTDFKKAKYF